MKFTIRKAHIKDLEDILALNLKLFEYEEKWCPAYNLKWTYSSKGKEYFKKRIESGVVFVAEADGKIVGYICGFAWHNYFAFQSPHIAELENMFVDENYRGQGIGTHLVKEFIKYFSDSEVKTIRVNTLFQNELAQKFYKSQNFKDFVRTLEIKL